MGQNSKIEFRCLTEQKTKIESRAEMFGMNLKTFLLMLGLHAELKSPVLSIDESLKKKYVKKKRVKIKTIK